MRTNPESERSQSDACINSTCQLGYGTEGQGLGADLHHAGSAQIAMPSPSRSNHLRKKREQNNNNITRTSTSDREQDKRAKKQHHNGITGSGSSKQLSTGYGSTSEKWQWQRPGSKQRPAATLPAGSSAVVSVRRTKSEPTIF